MNVFTLCTFTPARPLNVVAGKMRKCRQCGVELARTVKRCPHCGQPLSCVRQAVDAVGAVA